MIGGEGRGVGPGSVWPSREAQNAESVQAHGRHRRRPAGMRTFGPGCHSNGARPAV